MDVFDLLVMYTSIIMNVGGGTVARGVRSHRPFREGFFYFDGDVCC